MTDDPAARIKALLAEAGAMVGPGEVRLEVVSEPVIEWVYLSLEADRVVVGDNGATFASIAGLRGDADDYLDWSPERARIPARTFGVALIDESSRNEAGEVLTEGWRLSRELLPGESAADVVQAVAHAIDGVLAVHVEPDSVAFGSYFWDHDHEATDV